MSTSAVGSREALLYLPIAKACTGTIVCFVFELLLGIAVAGYQTCVLQVGLVNLCHYVHIVKVLIITYYTTVLSSVTLESLSDDVMRCLCAKYPEIPRVLSLRAFR